MPYMSIPAAFFSTMSCVCKVGCIVVQWENEQDCMYLPAGGMSVCSFEFSSNFLEAKMY